MTCGIYMIQNLVNGKMYIGQAVDIERRWGDHKACLRGNQNKPNEHLQRAWNKYGEDNFEFTVICKCGESQLNTMEIDYIAKLKTYDPKVGYNKTYGGEGGRPTEETKRKRSEALKGHIVSEESKRKMSEAAKGRTLSEEHKKKLIETHKGKTLSEETRRKMSESRKGHIVSEETKQKLSEAHKGKTLSEDTKRKLSEYHKGRTLSEETKKKVSENNSRYWEGKTRSEDTKRKLSIPVVQIDPTTNKIINVWGSSSEANREGGFHPGAINSCCKNKFNREGNNIYKEYRWCYLHEYISQIDPRIKKVILFGKEYTF